MKDGANRIQIEVINVCSFVKGKGQTVQKVNALCGILFKF
jgi:hypothetical protein